MHSTTLVHLPGSQEAFAGKAAGGCSYGAGMFRCFAGAGKLHGRTRAADECCECGPLNCRQASQEGRFMDLIWTQS